MHVREASPEVAPSILPRLVNPVLYWHEVALDLDAFDHSIPAEQARAIGPCAAARAMGLIHAAIADAVAACDPRAGFKGQFKQATHKPVKSAEAFVGGAAAAIMLHIYDSAFHREKIETARIRFFKQLPDGAFADWTSGVAFVESSGDFTGRWNAQEIAMALLPRFSTYVPKPRRHNVDPFNAGQGFYGDKWGDMKGLILSPGQIKRLLPKPPPQEGDTRYRTDLADVRARGAFATATAQQRKGGLFWAYDGANLIGTPPRLYNQIVRQVMDGDLVSVPEMARRLALCNLAMADASIVAWRAKYLHAVWRPVLGIQNAQSGADPGWRPLGAPRSNREDFALGVRDPGAPRLAQSELGASGPTHSGALGGGQGDDGDLANYRKGAFTPNFPAYPSGHATFGGACFTALERLRGKADIDIEFVSDELDGATIDNFEPEPRPRLPMRFTSIAQLIQANDESRVLLGVHWKFDSTAGSESGKRIAEEILKTAYRRQ